MKMVEEKKAYIRGLKFDKVEFASFIKLMQIKLRLKKLDLLEQIGIRPGTYDSILLNSSMEYKNYLKFENFFGDVKDFKKIFSKPLKVRKALLKKREKTKKTIK